MNSPTSFAGASGWWRSRYFSVVARTRGSTASAPSERDSPARAISRAAPSRKSCSMSRGILPLFSLNDARLAGDDMLPRTPPRFSIL